MNEDIDFRARLTIKNALEKDLYVEAGAGAGKTSSLVERICALVENGTPIEQMAVITFTRAAASELRTRIRESLERTANGSISPAAENASAALRRIGEASIQTIDSFALSLLQERGMDYSDLPFRITPLSQAQDASRFAGAWNIHLEGLLSRPHTPFILAIERLRRIGLPNVFAKIREVAIKCHRSFHLMEKFEFDIDKSSDSDFDFAEEVKCWTRLLAELGGLLDLCTDKEDRLYVHLLDSALPALEQLVSVVRDRDMPELDYVLGQSLRFKFSKGRKDNWQDDGKPRVSGLLDEAEGRLAALRARVLGESVATIVEEIRGFIVDYANVRRLEGSPNFHDMLVWALRLLSDNDAELRRARRKFKHILVDEFQDTSPLQQELINMFTEEREDAPDIPRSLFFAVGDPKQSIYGFRYADPQTAAETRDKYKPDERIVLKSNHRSQPEIIDWLNDLFDVLMNEEGSSSMGWQAEYIRSVTSALRLNTSSDSKDDQSPIKRVGAMVCLAVHADRKEEAEALADMVAWVGSGGCNVRATYADETGYIRPSNLGDVCILVRSRSQLQDIRRALEYKNVPFILEGMEDLQSNNWIADVLNVLEAIDNPSNSIAVFAALRSPLYGCSDVEIWQWKNAGGWLNLISRMPREAVEAAPMVKEALDDLRKRSHQKRFQTVPALIERLIQERRIRETVLLSDAEGNAEDTMKLLDLLIEETMLLDEEGGASLGTFLLDFRRSGSSIGESEHKSVFTERSDARVAASIRTIHSAKGLEFPVVFLVPSVPVCIPPNVLFPRSFKKENAVPKIQVRFGATDAGFKVETLGYDAASDIWKATEEAEDVRVLYVGATRARDHLFVSLRKRDKFRWRVILEEKTGIGWPNTDGSGYIPRSTLKSPSLTVNRNRWLERLSEDVQAAKCRKVRYINATDLHPSVRPWTVAQQVKDEEELIERQEARGKSSTDIGKAVHMVLQILGPKGIGDDLDAVAGRTSAYYGIPKSAGVVSRLARSALDSPSVKRASCCRFWMEMPIVAPIDEEVYLQGFIDLVFEEMDGSLTIVEYKTDRLDRSSKEAHSLYYMPQVGAYVYALELSSRRKVAKAVILFSSEAAEGRAAETLITGSDLNVAKRQAVDLALHISQQE